MSETMEFLGPRLATLREAHGWSLRELGAKAGTNASTILRIERGGEANLSTVIMIAEALGTTLGHLLEVPACNVCDDRPPAGFQCLSCGKERH